MLTVVELELITTRLERPVIRKMLHPVSKQTNQQVTQCRRQFLKKVGPKNAGVTLKLVKMQNVAAKYEGSYRRHC